MKPEFAKYLEDIGVPNALIDRIDRIYLFYEGLSTAHQITDIFVTDYLDETKQRNYQNLWFFTDTYYCMEAKGFATQDNFDMMNVEARVSRWEITKQDYDFKKATALSRLAVSLSLTPGHSGNLNASMNNCDYLKTIFLKYFLPNVMH